MLYVVGEIATFLCFRLRLRPDEKDGCLPTLTLQSEAKLPQLFMFQPTHGDWLSLIPHFPQQKCHPFQRVSPTNSMLNPFPYFWSQRLGGGEEGLVLPELRGGRA